MSICKDPYQKRAAFYEKLLAASLVFAPYTLLRIGRIGIPEFCIMVLAVLVLAKEGIRFGSGRIDEFLFTRFWLFFLAISSLGFLNNYFFLGFPSGSLRGMFFDSASYAFVFACCLVLESIITSGSMELNIWKILKGTYLTASIALGILFLFGRFTNSSYLMYYAFFRPFATNIHHVSMFIAPLPFIGLKMLREAKGYFLKIGLVLLIMSNILIGLATGSSKVFLAFIAGGLVFLLAMPFSLRMSKYTKCLLFSLMTLLLFLGGMIFAQDIAQKAVSFFVESDASDARSILYRSAITKFANSPIVGYGAGPHAEFRSGYFSDTHQTLLTALLQAGILGAAAYFWLTVAIFKKCMKDPFILGACTAILLYALGGDILRRLPMWLFLILFYYYCMYQRPVVQPSRQ